MAEVYRGWFLCSCLPVRYHHVRLTLSFAAVVNTSAERLEYVNPYREYERGGRNKVAQAAPPKILQSWAATRTRQQANSDEAWAANRTPLGRRW